MKANRKFSKDEDAVSPVIGVILMVAITVILAAVIASFVFGMGGNLNKQYLVAATASQVGDDIIVTYNGGHDHASVTWFNITQAGTNTTGTTAENPDVGYTVTFSGNGSAGNSDTVVATIEFEDGTNQVILNTVV